jgi:lysophospholipase L1-like esterase
MTEKKPIRLVAYGDCNTLGFRELEKKSYPEIIGAQLNANVTNLGHTMSTTRELIEYARAYPAKNYDIALIQYGLVDSWLTFRHSPYVLYYPTNPWRKFLRKLVKKIKKYARTLRVHEVLGWQNVVPLEEYIQNIEAIITSAPKTRFVLISTAPNHDLPRNPRIEEYNSALQALSLRHQNTTYVDTYHPVSAHMSSSYFEDGTHLNKQGLEIVAAHITKEITKNFE